MIGAEAAGGTVGGTAGPPPGAVRLTRRGGEDAAYARRVICDACRESEHERCPGGSWCDCQHRTPGPVEPVTGPPGE